MQIFELYVKPAAAWSKKRRETFWKIKIKPEHSLCNDTHVSRSWSLLHWSIKNSVIIPQIFISSSSLILKQHPADVCVLQTWALNSGSPPLDCVMRNCESHETECKWSVWQVFACFYIFNCLHSLKIHHWAADELAHDDNGSLLYDNWVQRLIRGGPECSVSDWHKDRSLQFQAICWLCS